MHVSILEYQDRPSTSGGCAQLWELVAYIPRWLTQCTSTESTASGIRKGNRGVRGVNNHPLLVEILDPRGEPLRPVVLSSSTGVRMLGHFVVSASLMDEPPLAELFSPARRDASFPVGSDTGTLRKLRKLPQSNGGGRVRPRAERVMPALTRCPRSPKSGTVGPLGVVEVGRAFLGFFQQVGQEGRK